MYSSILTLKILDNFVQVVTVIISFMVANYYSKIDK